MIVNTPAPPYYAVIFTSLRTDVDTDYAATNDHLLELAGEIDGFLGMEAARDGLGIAVSYWRDLEAIDKWRKHMDHGVAKQRGRTEWYTHYKIRICKVEYDREFSK
ncbi:MAG: antibiotic biosynthesis monooxygenase [Flavobacteriales bacterium]|nr:antibiotic biosynthesis monooxygenase [Flavobacteriales bacterium]